ncbi:hypothetical protein AVEN_189001-1 [Araneus ventricosus]|uniref:CCHC-type domain-containing protein n=1 Tax=Araneus ventricosus TaxID=182803 RepID=A0A4Y2X990_ARAVE|nr:hypothetical protein AVEN_189001-1 [Araneus ventricosus]
MRSDDIVNVMYRENFPRFSQSACVQRFFNSEKAMQGNKIRRQIAFAEFRSATSNVGSRRKKLLDDHVNRAGGTQQQTRAANNKSGAFSGGTSRAYAGVNHRMYTANNDIGNASGADGDQRAHVTNNNNVYICKKCNIKHRRSECPAFGKQCFVCGNYNHFSVVCQMRSVQDVTCITENKETEPYVVTGVQSDFFIVSVSVLEVGKVTVTNE